MDLLSLPDEMLTVVLTHTKFGRLMMLRKMSKRIDVLARRSKLCERVPVDKFDYQDHLAWNQYTVRLYLDPDDDADLGLTSPVTFPATYKLAPIFQQYLPLIYVRQDFMIGSKIQLKEDDIAMLYEQRKSLRKVEKLKIHRTFFIEANEKYTRMLYNEIFPAIKMLNIFRCDDYLLIFNEELLSNRKWKRIEFESCILETNLNDEFFRKVVINCEEIEMINESRDFTVAGIVELLKNCIAADGLFNRKFDLGLLISRESAITNIQNGFNSVDFPGITLTINAPIEHDYYDEEVKLCKVTFEDHVDAPYLQFWLEKIPRY